MAEETRYHVISIRKINLRKYPQYKNKPWRVEWREGGKRKRRFHATQEDAMLDHAQQHARLNTELRAKSGMVVPYLDAIESYLSQLDNAENTRYQYKKILYSFGMVCDWPDSDHWTASLIRRYTSYRKNECERSIATVNKELRTLAAFFNWAVRPGRLIAASPFADLPSRHRQLRFSRPDPATWTPEQFAKVLEVCLSEEWRIFAELLVNGVGRHQDVAHLQVGQVDFQSGGIRLVETKTGKPKFAPIHSATMARLQEYVRSLGRSSGPLFSQHVFHPKTWRGFCEKAQVPYVRMHHLRICMSNWLQDQMIPAETVSRILNHSTPQTTLQWYTTRRIADARFTAVNHLPLPDQNRPEQDDPPDMFDAPLV